MILRDQVDRQGPVIVSLGLVKKRDTVPNFLAGQEYKNVLLISRPDAKASPSRIAINVAKPPGLFRRGH
jgi:hypothetical protein